MLAKEIRVLSKLAEELEKCGTNTVIFFSGKIQLGQFLRSFDLLNRLVPTLLDEWSLERIMNYPLKYNELFFLTKKDMKEIGERLVAPVNLITNKKNRSPTRNRMRLSTSNSIKKKRYRKFPHLGRIST